VLNGSAFAGVSQATVGLEHDEDGAGIRIGFDLTPFAEEMLFDCHHSLCDPTAASQAW
jgi:hypothetical protein